MATCLFRSPLAFRLQNFLETRRAAGRDDTNSQKILRYLDRFLMSELKPGEPINSELVERWLENMESLSPGTRINRVSLLRQFCLYLGVSSGNGNLRTLRSAVSSWNRVRKASHEER